MERIDGDQLDGVSATTLWTLRNRAEEAMRADSSFDDPLAVEAYRAIDTDFTRFGKPSQTHPLRALAVDQEIRDYLDAHPRATVVALAEGLQTSYWRLGRPVRRWLSVDLPPVIALRERLFPPEEAIEYRAMSALDTSWADDIEADDGVIVTAEGLLMYLTPEEARGLIAFLAGRFPGGVLVFDSIPHWFSRKTLAGLKLSTGYQAPPMPFALTVSEAAALIDLPGVTEVTDLELPPGRGPWKTSLLRTLSSLPKIRDIRPSLTRVRF
ncbi:class I SAM-dependent methyltransferase [Gordonia sp. PP30]|uniref:class I SAM-dependent methyltransferase n=1 Tax=Gordonia sp. PP30 TaxID=2935861 RepID=UPI0020001B36|nr:class I SAM-dependent methyltransferase [Gordonia sp. PP30]UQE76714.1 class I SAM-dependent methyltransferase [Gordonia sp. PP30]